MKRRRGTDGAGAAGGGLPLEPRVKLALVGLTLFFCLFPLTVRKPGLPVTLKADEPAYFMMAQSLAFDGDLRVDEEDVERVFLDYPYRPVQNLILMTDDGWRTAYYGKPYLYSLVAAPFVRLFGANGMVFLNMALTFVMVWTGTLYLARFNPHGRAALFAAAFFLLSAGFTYVFWLHPEVFAMAGVALALFLALHPFEGRRWAGWAPAASGVALAFAAYGKPMIALLGAPIVVGFLVRRRWRRALLWLGGALAGGAIAVGLAVALTGHPTPYLGVTRQGVRVCQEGTVPITPGPEGGAAPADHRPTGGAWSWIFRVPDVDWGQLAENGSYFLVGRHTGLLVYFPFAALALVLFLIHSRRDPARWTLVAALAVVALFFLVFIPRNWQGGGGFVGNRYFVNLVPAFLFLATRLSPRGLLPAGFAAAGLFLGPLLFTPFGASQAAPTLQAHVRSAPYRLLPLELTLHQVPGYEEIDLPTSRIVGRRDQLLPRGSEAWVLGGDETELFFLTSEEVDRAVFRVRSLAPDNRVRVRMGGDEEELAFRSPLAGWEDRTVTLEPDAPARRTHRRGEEVLVYRIEVASRGGRNRLWTRNFPPNVCPDSQFAYWESVQESFYVGAALTYLGEGETLADDVFSVRWDRTPPGLTVEAGATATVPVRLTNSSASPWRASGAAEVKLAYHWRDTGGGVLVYDGLRTPLPLPVPPGGTVAVEQEVETPSEPGRYVLELDLVFEHVDWFSRRGAETRRIPVRVVPPGPGEAGGPG